MNRPPNRIGNWIPKQLDKSGFDEGVKGGELLLTQYNHPVQPVQHRSTPTLLVNRDIRNSHLFQHFYFQVIADTSCCLRLNHLPSNVAPQKVIQVLLIHLIRHGKNIV